MAIDNGSGASGSLGHLIYYYRKGKKCIRTKPAHVFNPKTASQTHYRTKMSMAGKLIRNLRKFIDIGYQATEMDMPMNEARQYMLNNCFTKSADGATIMDYPKVIISRGEIAKPQETSLTIEGNTAHINWKTPVKGDYTDGDDKVMIAMFMDEGKDGLSQLLCNVAYRKDGSCTVPVPLSDEPVHMWMFFYNPDIAPGESRRKVSESVYLVNAGTM